MSDNDFRIQQICFKGRNAERKIMAIAIYRFDCDFLVDEGLVVNLDNRFGSKPDTTDTSTCSYIVGSI